MNRFYYLIGAVGLLSVGLLATSSCDRKPRPIGRRSTSNAQATRQANASVLFDTVAKTLNALPDEVALDLQPPVVILDDSRSTNGKEVLATLSKNPQDPEGGFGYLSVPAGNANFRGLGVQAGDIVRYFIKYDTESLEHGGGVEVDYIEIPVRRLDIRDPQNALILDTPLNGPVEIPHRIEIWRFSDRRVNEIRIRVMNRYIPQRRPAVAWEPSPDESALVQLVDRANQWFRNFRDEVSGWELEPLLDSLPEEAHSSESFGPRLKAADLRDGVFDLAEVRSLQEAIWMRDISAWAKKDAFEKVDVAKQLFDWTIRNVQLDPPDQPGIIHQPWQALMYGHGKAEHRAWVFAELCRQQLLDVVMLEFPTGTISDDAEVKTLPALIADGSLYLFDPSLGLPLPGAENETVGTLDELAANSNLVSELDLDEQHPYPLKSEDFQNVNAYLVATPLQMSRRAKALQDALQGEEYVTLYSEGARIAEALKSIDRVKLAGLWTFPFEDRLAEESMKRPQREAAAQQFLLFSYRPKLWKARVLHFMGSKPIPVAKQSDPLAQPRLGHREATALYQSPDLRLPDDVLEKFEPGKQMLYRAVKNSASYWLGLLSYDVGKFDVAEDWFRRRTLTAMPNGPWANGATYNLARTLEKLDRIEEAAELLSDDRSPQQYGNRLRATWLKQSGRPDKSPANE